MKTKYFALFFWALFIHAAISCQQVEQSASMEKNYPMLVSQPELSTFASLMEKAGLISFFQGSGPFTFFAPSNDAFKKMDQVLLARLQKPENKDELIDFINYHVLLGTYRKQNGKSGSYKTVNGKSVQISIENGKATVNGIDIVNEPIEGPNGVGYIIDSVLMPNA